jgi:DNA polymerase III alpha subunit
MKMPDIDIDFVDRKAALDLLRHIPASRLDDGELVKHNTGVYLHPVPVLPQKNISSIDYQTAEDQRFFKIDFLNVNLYEGIENENHLSALMSKEPLWELLQQTDFVDMLFHVNGHSDILQKTKPESIEQLAAVLAMIRPAKRYLVDSDWDHILNNVWTKPDNNEYYFKKSHATAYAVAVVVQMNLICEKLSSGNFSN